MMMNKSSSILTTFTFIILLLCAIFEFGFCREFGIVKIFNGVDDHKSSSSEMESIARFAVQEHNKRENALLQFERVLKAKEEVVVGKIYHLTLVVYDAGKITKAVYKAKVWVKPGRNFKQLQEFKNVIDTFESARSAHEILPDGLGSRKVAKVPVHDPQIQAAANHLVAAINQRINSEVKYELVEILQAEAEVVEECLVRYEIDMRLKPKIASGDDKAQI